MPGPVRVAVTVLAAVCAIVVLAFGRVSHQRLFSEVETHPRLRHLRSREGEQVALW
jgi:hypothetical protein